MNSTLRPESSDSHLVFSEGSSLVGTDVVCSSHCFTGSQKPNQVVLILHLAYGVSQ
jgi:hypothetical protein